MSRTVHVDLGERSYDIRIATNISGLDALVGKEGSRCLMVSDSNVDPIYGDKWQLELEKLGLAVERSVVPAGEESKSLAMMERLYGDAINAGLDRSSVIIALGGGMVGDLAGFVAATYLRGVNLIQIPTSLLAMVDSSVGGKTAIDLPQGKNLVGSFFQPLEVAVDIAALETLPDREYVSGLGEVVKYGVIWDADFFAELESGVVNLLNRDNELLVRIIARCCEIKAEVVRIDERESGLRGILNFGHTLAHAVEKVAGYGTLLHGEAVSIGMVYAAELSCRVKGFPVESLLRLKNLLQALGLSVSLEQECSWSCLSEAMKVDKKTLSGIPRFVLAEQLGTVTRGNEVSESVLAEAFECL